MTDIKSLTTLKRGFEKSVCIVWVQQIAIRARVRVSIINGKEHSCVTPHIFRHPYATNMLQGGADLRAIQETLGHQSVATPQIYAKADSTMIQEVHAACHPRPQWHLDNKE